jgi:hypothetical protein
MEEDDFDACMAELEIPELSNPTQSSSKSESNSEKTEATKDPTQSSNPADPKLKSINRSNAIIVNSRQRGEELVSFKSAV